MVEYLTGHYSYWLTAVLICIGMYGVLLKHNLVKKLIGMGILQAAIILFYVSIASKTGATVPVYDPAIPVTEPERYMNPLPHTLMLTAIVVGVATQGVALALLLVVYNRHGTLDEREILEDKP